MKKEIAQDKEKREKEELERQKKEKKEKERYVGKRLELKGLEN